MTTQMPHHDQLAHVQSQLDSGMTAIAYCKANGINSKTFGNWAKRYRTINAWSKTNDLLPKNGSLTVVKETSGTALPDALEKVNALLAERDVLRDQLHDANVKIKALQNVIVILGHQVGSE